jgi:hypothetical protein
MTESERCEVEATLAKEREAVELLVAENEALKSQTSDLESSKNELQSRVLHRALGFRIAIGY